MSAALQHAVRRLTERQSLTREESEEVMHTLMSGEAPPVLVGALLVALKMQGETVAEVVGFVKGMRSRVVPVTAARTPLLDTCGTGGSAFRVFNVSTAAAFVAAAAGITVAKHGNRAVTGVCGSADVLEASGVRVDLSPEECAACIDAVGIGFLYAPAHHPAMRHISVARREIGVRTIFNLVGPLANPAGAAWQTMGVYEPRLCRLEAGALRELGSERAIVAHGTVGLDEISTIGITSICELRGGETQEYVLTPEELGLTDAEPNFEMLLPARTPAENADIVREVLTGKSETADGVARRNLVAVNAAASLRVSGIIEDWKAAVRMAQEILLSGAALEKMEQLAAFTNSLPDRLNEERSNEERSNEESLRVEP